MSAVVHLPIPELTEQPDDPLEAFIYLLVRDYVPLGELIELIARVDRSCDSVTYSAADEVLLGLARQLADALRPRETSTPTAELVKAADLLYEKSAVGGRTAWSALQLAREGYRIVRDHFIYETERRRRT